MNWARKLEPLRTAQRMVALQSMMARYGVNSTTMILLQKEYAELSERRRQSRVNLQKKNPNIHTHSEMGMIKLACCSNRPNI